MQKDVHTHIHMHNKDAHMHKHVQVPKQTLTDANTHTGHSANKWMEHWPGSLGELVLIQISLRTTILTEYNTVQFDSAFRPLTHSGHTMI